MAMGEAWTREECRRLGEWVAQNFWVRDVDMDVYTPHMRLGSLGPAFDPATTALSREPHWSTSLYVHLRNDDHV